MLCKLLLLLTFLMTPKPLPAVFLSHGGPNFMHRGDSGVSQVYDFLKVWGTQIKNGWQPGYVVVVSAHWQASGDNEVNIAVPQKKNDLIYDFGGFPAHYYEEKFKYAYSQEVAETVQKALVQAGFVSNLVPRGVDHGVWVPFKVAFSDYSTVHRIEATSTVEDLENTPIVQVSLPKDEDDFDTLFRLGRALNTLRSDPKALVVVSGMSVHNLYDLRREFPQPYAAEFNQLIRDSLKATSGQELLEEFKRVQKKPIFRKAHPTSEHFAPLVVGAGLMGSRVKEVFNEEQGSLGWGFYCFD